MNGPRSALRGALLLAFAIASEAASAQATIAPSAAASAAERAQKETDRTMYWIRVLADRPAPVKAAPATTPKPAAVPATKAVAEVREKPKSVVVPATTTVAAAPTAAALGKPSTPSIAPGLDTSEPTSALSSSIADKAAVAPAPVAELPPASAQVDEPDPGLAQIKSVRPDFPGRIVMRVHKGHVEVRFEVEPGGTVTDAVVVDSSDAHLNQAAIDAVKQWQFKPSSRYHTAAVDLAFDIDKE